MADGPLTVFHYRLASGDVPTSPAHQPLPAETDDEAQAGQQLTEDSLNGDAPPDETYLPGLSLRDRFSPEQPEKKVHLHGAP